MFIFTCNDIPKNENLINRPSRIRYRTHFDSLSDDVVNDVIDDILVNKSFKESIISVLNTVGIITFDILIELIKEINLFNEPADIIVKYLNIEKSLVKVDIYEIWNGQSINVAYNYPIDLSKRITLSLYRNDSIFKEYNELDHCLYVPIQNIKRIDSQHWEYKDDSVHLIFKRFSRVNLI